MEIELFDDKNGMTVEIRQEFKEEKEIRIHPEHYVLQTLDDAALVLTVCRMALQQARLLPTQRNEVYMRLTKVRELLDAVDSDVAQNQTVIDSSIEGN